MQYSDEIINKIKSLDKFASGLVKNEKYENALYYAKRALEKDCSNEKLMELIDNINKKINACVWIWMKKMGV